jgi:hypothetical protein
MEYIELTEANLSKHLADIKFHLYSIWDDLEAINNGELYEIELYLYTEMPPDIDNSECESIITLMVVESPDRKDLTKCLGGIFGEDVLGNQIMMNNHLLELSKYIRGGGYSTLRISRPTAHELAEICQQRNSSSQSRKKTSTSKRSARAVEVDSTGTPSRTE